MVRDDLQQNHHKQHQVDQQRVYALLRGKQQGGAHHAEMLENKQAAKRDDDRQDEHRQDIACLHFKRAVFRGNQEIEYGSVRGSKKWVQNVAQEFTQQAHHISLRRRATGISNCSRYLATVLRAMGYPFSFRMPASLSSVSGFRLSSSRITVSRIFFISRVETYSPSTFLTDSEKKSLINLVP